MARQLTALKVLNFLGSILASFVLLALLPFEARANSAAVQSFTYEGRLYDTAGNPLAESVNFRVQILNSASDCVLYEETQTFNLSSSKGRFALEVGSDVGAGKRTGDDPGFAMWQVFKNTGSLAVPAGVCPGTPFNPALGEKRKLRVFIDPASGPEEKLSPDQSITSSPSSLMSQSLQGIGADGFVQITGNITQSNLDDLSSEHTDLMDLAAGTSSLYMAAGSSVTTDDVFASDQMAVGTTTPAAGVELEIQNNDPTLRLEATDGGAGNMAIQFFDTAGTDQAQIMSTEGTAGLTFSTGGASALVLDGSQNAQFQASMTVAGTIQGGVYDNAQEAGTLLPALTTCGAGCAGTQWMNSDLSLLRYWDGAAVRSVGSFSGAETAGQVLTSNGPGNAPSFQVIDDTTKLSLDGSDTMAGDLNMGGNEITNLGAPVNPSDAVNKTYADSNLVGESLSAPGAGQNGQAIRWNDGAGNWEYFSPTAGTVSAVSATAPLASSGGATPDISLNFNDGLMNNGGNLEVNLSSDLTFSTGQVAIATDGVTSTHILDGTISNIDIDASADIARTKLADGTANMVLINDGTGNMSESATIDAAELGFLNNVSSNIQTQLDGKEASLGFTPVNKAGDSMTGALAITGSADAVQLSAQAQAAQTANLFELKNSAGTPIFTVQADGTISAATDIASKNYVDTEIAGLTDNDTTYTADGEGIEVASEEFSLELDGNTLSKSATGLKVEEGNLTLSNIGGYDANENVDHTSVTLTAGTGLTGGGDISANRTFNVVGGDGITANADDITVNLDTDPGLEFNTGAIRVKTGAGLGRDSTGVFHTDTSSVADSDNANGVILQDITFDTFGHVQTVGTTDLDSRYYTETESDSNFVDASGDSMSGPLTMNTQSEIRLSDDDDSDYISLKAPTGTTQYDLTLPNAVGNANDVLQTDASGNLSWVAIPSAPVTDVFGRAGNVVAQSGDYNAGQITSSVTGNVSATNVQAAITELDTEKVATTRNVNTPAAGGLTGGGDLSSDRTLSIDITGMTATSTQNAGDEILIFSGADTAMRKMSRSDFIAGIDTDTDTTYTADGEGIELSGTTFGLELDGATLQKGASGLSVNQGNIDHGSIGGLTDDDHTQYAHLTGRSGGQSLVGGTDASDDLTLESTSNATKGDLILQPNGGNVGVGTATPSEMLVVGEDAGDLTGGRGLVVGDSGGSSSVFVAQNSTNWGRISLQTDKFAIQHNDGGSLSSIYMDSGNVGIGTTAPDTSLHVTGGIKIGTMAAGDCDAIGEAGRIRYNSGDLDYCDGSSWQTLGTAAGGEVNTAANVGTGTGLFRDKTGTTINLKSINAEAGGEISITNNANDITLDVVEGNLDITAIGGYDANENIDHTSVTLTAGTGLTGGGDISANRTFNVVGGDGIVANADDIAVDLDTDPGLEFNTGSLRVKTGAGLGRDSTGVFHTDTSSVADSDNSNGVILQDITFDTFGHVQTVGTTDLDGRYYTEAESDSTFVDASGDAMTGALAITGSVDSVQLSVQAQAAQTANLFELKNSAGTPVFTVQADGTISAATDIVDKDYVDTAIGGLTDNDTLYTADGEGIEVASEEFSLELDGTTLSKSATGLKVNAIGSTEITNDTITNDDINSSAAIARTKLASGTANMVLINDGTGAMSESATIDSTELGHLNGVSSNIQTQLDGKQASLGYTPVDVAGDTMTGALDMGAGAAQLSTTDSEANPAFTFQDDANTGIFSPAADEVAISTAGAEALRIDDTGNIGIGTGNPSNNIEIRDDSGQATVYLDSNADDSRVILDSADGFDTEVVFKENGVSRWDIYNDGTDDKLKFWDFSVPGPVVTIAPGGNVGIGTASPSQKLHVSGAGNVYGLIESTSSGAATMRLKSPAAEWGWYASETIDRISLYDYTAGATHMTVLSGGNVGIGTTTPDTPLHVAGGIKIGTMAAGDCDAAGEAGRIRYNSGDLDYCDGSSWQTLGTAAGGEINTAANVGTGVGLFRDKTGTTINLKSINAEAGGEISITNNANDITLDVVEGNLDITAIGGYDANDNVDHTSVDMIAGDGLTGGGDISSDRTFNVVGGDGITANADDIAIDLDTDPGLEFNTGAIRVKTGAGLGRDSTGIFHTDTSSVADSDNSNGVILQDITFDTFGHVQTVGTTDLDSRYYTETESDSNFVDASGDSMTGALAITGSADSVQLSAQAQAAQTANLFELKNSAGTPIFTVQADGTISAATDIVDKDYVDTAIGGLTDNDTTYTADGEGIEVASEEFSLELDGTTLSKSATGLKVNAIGSTEITNDSITNDDINASAAIARSKIATGTASRVLVNDGSGNLSESATIDATELGHLNGVSSNIQTQLDGKQASLGYTPVDVAGDTMTGALDMGAGAAQLSTTDSEATPAFTFQDDTNTGVFSPAADELAISTAGSEALRVDGSGNVGIGTTNPANTLHVKSDVEAAVTILETPDGSTNSFNELQFRSDSDPKWSVGHFGDLNGNSSRRNDFYIYQYQDQSDVAVSQARLTIDDLGNVGIGTIAPDASALLDVSSTTKGFLPPRMTSAERDAVTTPAEGLTVFNTTTDKLNVFAGGAWTEAGGGSFGSGNSGFVGSLKYAGTTNCDAWNLSNNNFTSFTTVDNGCNAPTTEGAASAPTEGKIPAIRFASLPAGRYRVVANGTFDANGSGSRCHYRLFDGTNGAGSLEVHDTAASRASYIIGDFTYSSAQSDHTFYIQGADDGTGTTCNIFMNITMRELSFQVTRIDGQGTAVELADADSNTKVMVEKNADENIIRFDTAGTERMTIDATGDVSMTGDLTANSFTGDGSALTNIGATAIADGSITLADTNFGSTNGINIPQLAADPGSPTAGQMYYNTTSNKMMIYNGSSFVEAGEGSGDFLADGSVAMTDQLEAVTGSAGTPGISFTGDTNTGIYSTGADTLSIAVGGTEAFTLNHNGGSQFFNMYGVLGVDAFSATTYASSGAVPSPSNLGGGRIGVGNDNQTDSTYSMLDLSVANGSSNYQKAYVGAVSNSAGFTPEIVIGQQTAASAYQERMRIDASGNVGIGTATPNNILHLANTASAGTPQLIISGTSGQTIASLGDGNSGANFESGFLRLFNEGTQNVFLSSAASSWIVQDLGIGTTSPNAKLTVEGVMTLDQQGSDPTGTAGYGSLYTKTDGSLYYRDGTGTVTDLLAGDGDLKSDGTVAMAADLNLNGNSLNGVDNINFNFFNTQFIPSQGNFNTDSGFRFNFDADNNETDRKFVIGANGAEQFFDPTNALFTVIESGNVGIGTASPSYDLHVSKSVAGSVRTAVENTNASGEAYLKAVNNTGAEVAMGIYGGSMGAYGDIDAGDAYILVDSASTPLEVRSTGAMSFGVGAGASGEHLVIDTNGNVGIGTTNPGAELEVSKSQNSISAIEVNNVNTGANAKAQFIAASDAGIFRIGTDSAAAGSGAYVWNEMNSQLEFGTNNVERMRIDNSGNIGIGTTSPNAKLTVEGVMTLDQQGSDPTGTAGYGSLYTKTDGSLYYRDGTGTVTDLLAGGGGSLDDAYNSGAATVTVDGTGGGDVVWNLTSTNDFHIQDNGSAVFTVRDNGRVGIGVTAPDELFHVDGDVKITRGNNADDSGGLFQIQGTGHEYFQLGSDGSTVSGGGGAFSFGIDGQGNGAVIGTDGSDIEFKTGIDWQSHPDGSGSTRLYIQSSNGNIGVGTSSPNARLTVEGVMTLDQQGSDPAGTAGYGSLYTKTDGSLYYRDGTGTVTDLLAGGGSGDFLANGTVPMTGNIRLNGNFLSNDGGNEGISVDNSGNVTVTGDLEMGSGNYRIIGGNSGNPLSLVFNQGGSGFADIQNNCTATDCFAEWQAKNSGGNATVVGVTSTGFSSSWLSASANYLMGAGSEMNIVSRTASGPIRFLNGNATTPIERMRIDSAGNVGIGAISPNSKLTVEGAMTLDQLGADPTGTAGYGSLYTKTDGKLYYRDGTGTVTDLLAGGGGGDFMADGSVPMTGVFEASFGSAASPSIAFNGDEDTGLYRAGTNDIGFATAGLAGMTLFNTGRLSVQHATNPELATWRDDTVVTAGESLGRWLVGDADHNSAAMVMEVVATVDHTASVGDNDIKFLTRSGTTDGEKMRITSAGNVGIGETAPDSTLEINGTTRSVGTFRVAASGVVPDLNSNTATNVGFNASAVGVVSIVRNAGAPLSINRTGADGPIIAFRAQGTAEGNITVAGTTVSYNAFTGSHFASLPEPIERGLLVEIQGNPEFRDGDTSSEPLYDGKLSSKENSPAILGAFLALNESTLPFAGRDNPYQVMSVGNGDVWVVDNGHDIKVGDYLISSSTPGHAEVDIGKHEVAHIIAKAGQNIDWSQVTDYTEDGKKRVKMTVTFEQFDLRHGMSEAARREISALKEENKMLKEKLDKVIKHLGIEE